MGSVLGFIGLVVGFVAAWELKRTHYMHLEWRLRVRQVKETRRVFLNEMPKAMLAAAAVILAVRVLF